MQISWVNKKTINFEKTNTKLNECLDSRHFTNNGKNVVELQDKIKKIFLIDDAKEVLLVNNGASGINALIGGLNMYFGKKLIFAVQSFTFPCSCQGLLMDSLIYDIDDNMGPNILKLDETKDKFDGILVTNCFGCLSNVKLYEDFCKKNNKILLFDNAASPLSFDNDGQNILNCGDGCIISFHHTKPIGFGEGGAIIFNRTYLDQMKKAICFGYSDTDKFTCNVFASNYKMSDISAIYIDQWLDNLNTIYTHHTKMIGYFYEKLPELKGVHLIKNYTDYTKCLMASIPIIFEKHTKIDLFIEHKIEAKKYYYPLQCYDGINTKSMDIFDKIICLPLNLDITEKEIDLYIHLIKQLL